MNVEMNIYKISMNEDIKEDNIPTIWIHLPYTGHKGEHNGNFTYAKSF